MLMKLIVKHVKGSPSLQETRSRDVPHAMCKVQRVAAVRRIHLANLYGAEGVFLHEYSGRVRDKRGHITKCSTECWTASPNRDRLLRATRKAGGQLLSGRRWLARTRRWPPPEKESHSGIWRDCGCEGEKVPTGSASSTASHNHEDGILRSCTGATYILADGGPDCSREKTRSQKRKHKHTVSGQMTWASSRCKMKPISPSQCTLHLPCSQTRGMLLELCRIERN